VDYCCSTLVRIYDHLSHRLQSVLNGEAYSSSKQCVPHTSPTLPQSSLTATPRVDIIPPLCSDILLKASVRWLCRRPPPSSLISHDNSNSPTCPLINLERPGIPCHQSVGVFRYTPIRAAMSLTTFRRELNTLLHNSSFCQRLSQLSSFYHLLQYLGPRYMLLQHTSDSVILISTFFTVVEVVVVSQ